MKKIIVLSIIAVTIAHCTSSKKTAASAPPAPVVSNTVPFEKELVVAQKTWPGTTVAELTDGQSIYYNKCTKCHDAYEIVRFDEKKWKHEIDDMSPKARLTVDEKLKLSKYILSFREANTVAKTN